MKKTLQEYALIAEIISAFAIVLSLVFVGIEVRRNTETSKASTYQSMIDLSHDRLQAVAESRDLAELSQSNWDDLDSVDQVRLSFWQRDWWRTNENAFIQYTRGVVGENEWIGYRSLMCGGDLDSSWEDHLKQLSPDFVLFIEGCNKRSN